MTDIVTEFLVCFICQSSYSDCATDLRFHPWTMACLNLAGNWAFLVSCYCDDVPIRKPTFSIDFLTMTLAHCHWSLILFSWPLNLDYLSLILDFLSFIFDLWSLIFHHHRHPRVSFLLGRVAIQLHKLVNLVYFLTLTDRQPQTSLLDVQIDLYSDNCGKKGSRRHAWGVAWQGWGGRTASRMRHNHRHGVRSIVLNLCLIFLTGVLYLPWRTSWGVTVLFRILPFVPWSIWAPDRPPRLGHNMQNYQTFINRNIGTLEV